MTSPMTPLSRSMLPSTQRSASRLCGGRRSTPPWSDGMAYSLCKGGTGPPAAAPATSCAGAAPGSGPTLFLFLLPNDEDLDLPLDVVAEVKLDGVQSRLLDRPFQADHVRLDLQVLLLQRLGDLGGADGAVQVALLV